MNIDRMVAGLLSRNEYTPESFQLDISYTEKCFKALKNIWGTENSILNELEREIFISMIKMISEGSNLVYDGSINFLNYQKLYEFYLKREKQYKIKETEKKFAISISTWIGKHIKGIIIFIIIIVFFHWISKDTDNTNNTNKQVVNYDTYIQNTTNSNHSKNTSDDYTITTDDLQLYQKNNSYVPGKTNPFASYE